MEASVSGGAAAPGRSGDGGGGSRADAGDDLDDLLDSALDDFDRVSGSAVATTSTTSSSSGGVGGGASAGLGTPTEPLSRDAATAAAGVANGSTAAAAGPSSSAAAQAPPEEVKGLGGGLRPLGPRKQGKKKKGGTGSGVGPSTQDATPSSSSSRAAAAAAGATSRQQQQQQQQQQQRPAAAAKSLRDTLEQLQARTRQTVDGMRAQDREREAAAADRAQQEGLEGEDGMGLEDEEMMEKLMKQFEDMGNQDIQGLMDVVMQQLLSKDVLYEPMREIGERYPAWLQANRATLSPDDVARYSRQHECILRLCRLYEASSPPAEFGQIVAVMKEMQECGQPPADIIKDLAPGLELGEDGLPMFPDLLGSGSGDLPRDCSIM